MPPKAAKSEYIETVSAPPPPTVLLLEFTECQSLVAAGAYRPCQTTHTKQDTGNKISRRSQIHGTQHIILGGKTVIQAEAVIRGDLYRQPSTATSSDGSNPTPASNAPSVAITVGRYSYISKSAVLRPPSRLHRGVHSYYPLKIGDHVFVGESAVIEAASLGNHVHVGTGAMVGSMAIVKDYAVILDGAVVPPGMVVPSWCVVGGRPARIVGEVGEGYGVEGAEGGMARERYRLVGKPQ
ncbi:Dynactin subunit 5 [Penicillium diatomitis]|uniref:Dynactin subunit 5 n=1 Tax=Penicillium diatomitis TaxID=2819901 RepID=A0A9W9XHL7_9EURO|nr:Dynactin subunit 5 [Penicillium diatomitis]KAJ5493049.1 Dynactin subunit 5 [Penicillium diatomitis]